MQQRGFDHRHRRAPGGESLAVSGRSYRRRRSAFQASEAALNRKAIAAREAAALGQSARIATSTAVQNAQDTFNRRLTSIDNNPNIGAEDRAGMIANIERQRDESLNLIEQVHNVDLDWTTAAPQAA